VDQNLDILVLLAGQFGGHPIFARGVLHLDVRPSAPAPERWRIESAKDVVEQSVHLAVESEQGVGRVLAGG
jgi:hypothetical protein